MGKRRSPNQAVLTGAAIALTLVGCGRTAPLLGSGDGSGRAYVKSDNPVLSGTAELTAGDGGLEEALRNNDSSWRFDHFQLLLRATGGDASQGSMDENGSAGSPEPWPAQRGDWSPGAGSNATFPWEAHGIRVGYSDLAIDVREQGASGRAMPVLHSVLRLHPHTILVPIQVAELVPDYAGAPSPAITEREGEATNEIWFDDRWGAHVDEVSEADGGIAHVSGSFAPRADASGGAGYYRQIQPDRLFGQCDIQFRMVAFRKVKVPKQIWEMVDAAGDPICKEAAIRSTLERALDLAFQAGLDPSAPVVVYTPSLEGDGCNHLPGGAIVDSTPVVVCSSCRHPFAAIAHFNLQGSPYGLSRELGHLLGLESLPYGCSASLMCSSKFRAAFTDGECSTARQGAAELSDRYYGTHF